MTKKEQCNDCISDKINDMLTPKKVATAFIGCVFSVLSFGFYVGSQTANVATKTDIAKINKKFDAFVVNQKVLLRYLQGTGQVPKNLCYNVDSIMIIAKIEEPKEDKKRIAYNQKYGFDLEHYREVE